MPRQSLEGETARRAIASQGAPERADSVVCCAEQWLAVTDLVHKATGIPVPRLLHRH